jgi:EF hand domain-containing protein
MIKQLSITLALVLAVACKTEAPTTSSSAPPGSEATTPAPRARSAKIDVKPVQPALPGAAAAAGDDQPADSPRGNRDDWRKRRDAKLDTNGDGVVSAEERAAAMHERMTAMHTRLDADGDGKLTPAELANAPGRMHFDDPAAIDTNHDGDISADELGAAITARRDQRRAARGSDQGRAPSEP